MRFAELVAGRLIEAGPRKVTAEEIVEFARRYDPQYFHVDRARAEASRWNGLIASGWLTCSIAMQLAVQSILADSESIGSPGVDELRWLAPVRPNDELRLRISVLESKVSSSGSTGIVRWRWDLENQLGTKVLTLLATSLFDISQQ